MGEPTEVQALQRLLGDARNECARRSAEVDVAHREFERLRDLSNEARDEYIALERAIGRLKLANDGEE